MSIQGEIEAFLGKRPLKQAISTLYAIQRLPTVQQNQIRTKFPELSKLIEEDYSLIERYYPGFLEIIPEEYREYIENKLNKIAEPMADNDQERLLNMNLFDS